MTMTCILLWWYCFVKTFEAWWAMLDWGQLRKRTVCFWCGTNFLSRTYSKQVKLSLLLLFILSIVDYQVSQLSQSFFKRWCHFTWRFPLNTAATLVENCFSLTLHDDQLDSCWVFLYFGFEASWHFFSWIFHPVLVYIFLMCFSDHQWRYIFIGYEFCFCGFEVVHMLND